MSSPSAEQTPSMGTLPPGFFLALLKCQDRRQTFQMFQYLEEKTQKFEYQFRIKLCYKWWIQIYNFLAYYITF